MPEAPRMNASEHEVTAFLQQVERAPVLDALGTPHLDAYVDTIVQDVRSSFEQVRDGDTDRLDVPHILLFTTGSVDSGKSTIRRSYIQKLDREMRRLRSEFGLSMNSSQMPYTSSDPEVFPWDGENGFEELVFGRGLMNGDLTLLSQEPLTDVQLTEVEEAMEDAVAFFLDAEPSILVLDAPGATHVPHPDGDVTTRIYSDRIIQKVLRGSIADTQYDRSRYKVGFLGLTAGLTKYPAAIYRSLIKEISSITEEDTDSFQDTLEILNKIRTIFNRRAMDSVDEWMHEIEGGPLPQISLANRKTLEAVELLIQNGYIDTTAAFNNLLRNTDMREKHRQVEIFSEIFNTTPGVAQYFWFRSHLEALLLARVANELPPAENELHRPDYTFIGYNQIPFPGVSQHVQNLITEHLQTDMERSPLI